MKDVYNPPLDMIKYKFDESIKISRIKEYIDSTYDKHYAHGRTEQATEVIRGSGHLEGFCIGNIIKYAQRYGKKVGEDKNNNLMKIVHYAIILMDNEQDGNDRGSR